MVMRPMHMIRSLFHRRTPPIPPTPPRPFIELMAVRPPGPDGPAHAWGHVLPRSAASLRARARQRTAEGGRLRGGVAGRMAGRTGRRLPARMAGTYGTEIVAGVHLDDVRQHHTTQWVTGVVALIGLSAIALLATVLTAAGAAAEPSVQAGWSGTGIYSPGARPVAVTVVSSLPRPMDVAQMAQSTALHITDVWAGFGGDATYGGEEVGDWLPQAGWDIYPSGDSRYWTISPWAIVCHSAGSDAEFPGWYGQDYVVPVGTEISSTLWIAPSGRIMATLSAAGPHIHLVFTRRIPTLPGEIVDYPLAEGIAEAPGEGNATATMSPDTRNNVPLLPMRPLVVTTMVSYATTPAPMPTLGTYDILQPGQWSDTTHVISYAVRGRTVITSARITFYRAR